MMQGNITAVKQWPDGGISVKVEQDWYKTKNVEMLQMQGRTITFNPAPWTNPNSGKITNWINDYSEAGAAPTSADQAFNQAHAGYDHNPPPMGSPVPPQKPPGPYTIENTPYPVDPPAPQRPPVDKDLIITALALVKCIEGLKTPQQAYEAFNEMKALLSGTSAVPFDDSLPF